MGIVEDREEFNSSGLRGLLKKAMKLTDEAFIKILAAGYQGEVLAARPASGSGPYLHYQRGFEVLEYRNSFVGDTQSKAFKVEV